MAGLHFDITGSNSNFMNKLRETENGIKRTSKQIEQTGLGIEDMFGRMAKAAAGFGVAFSAQQFASQVMKVRGEFQQLEVAFNTMLGSAEKANDLMTQLTRTAAITPFGLQDVAGGAKQLLAYGVAAENVNDTLVRLGDIAAGLSIPLNDLVYLYGTTMTQGRMFTQDLRQFQGRGIPLADELAKQFGVTKDKVGELVTAGKIGFNEMHKAIVSLTSDGGKFGGLMEAQSKTITGQISNIEDAIDSMFNEIGKSSEGAINMALSGVSALVENYEKVGEAIGVAVVAYGSYKAALMVGIALQKAELAITTEAAVQKTLAAMAGHTLSASQARGAAISQLFAAAQMKVAASLRAVSKATLTNPYVLVAAAITGALYGLYKFATAETESEKAAKNFNDRLSEQKDKFNENKKKVDDLVSSLGNLELSEGERAANFQELKQLYPSILENINDENQFLKEKHKVLQDINKEQERQLQLDKKIILSEAQKHYDDALARMNKALGVKGANQDLIRKNFQPELDKYKETLDKAKAETASLAVSNFLGGVKDMKSEDIASVLEEVSTILQSMGDAGNNAIGFVGSVSDDIKEFSKSQLQSIKSALEGEQKNRSGEKNTASQWLTKYKKEYQAAEKALKDFQNNKNKLSLVEYERRLKELSDARDAAKKKYEEAGGSVKADDKSIENQQRIADELLSIRRKNQHDEINLMQEGSKKRLKQIELDYQKELDEIKKQERALKEKQGGNLTYEQKSAITNRGLIAEKTRAKAILEVEKELIEKYQSNAQKRLEIEKKYNKDIQELQEARVIAEERGDKIAVDNFTKSIAKATSDKGKALIAHDLDVLKESPEYIRAFEDLNNTSTETLQNLLIELERVKQAAAESYDVENLKEYTDAIKAIHDELVERNPFQGLIESQKELIANKDKLKEYAHIIEVINSGGKVLKTSRLNNEGKRENVYWTLDEALKAYNRTKDASIKSESKFFKNLDTTKAQIDELSNSIKVLGDSIGGSIGGIISLIGDVSLAVTYTIDGMAKVAATGANALSAVEKASVILGIISTAIQLLNKISSLFADSFQQYQAYAEKVKEINTLSDAVNQYRMALIEARHEEENWFSVNNLKNLKDYKEIQTQALEDYLEKLNQEQAIYQNQGGGGWLTTIWKPVTEFIDATLGNIYGFEINKDYQKGTTSARNNLRIETRKKSSGFLGSGIGGKSQKTEDLQQWINKNKKLFEGLDTDLFDENNMINKELARAILENYGEKLVGQTKETLEQLIELKEKYDEYIAELREYVSSMYEPLVDNFVDSLWAWFDEGKDALDSFKEYASDTFRDIVSDMMRTIVLEQVVGSFSDDIADIYEKYATGQLSEDELMKEVAKRTEGLIDNYEANIPALQDLMNNVNEAFKAAGIDLNEAAAYSQEASSKGFQAMSQDTGDELNGRFTALQISGEEIKNQMIQSVVIMTQMLNISSQNNGVLNDILIQQALSNGYLEDIAKYSKIMSMYGEKIDKIVENTQNL